MVASLPFHLRRMLSEETGMLMLSVLDSALGSLSSMDVMADEATRGTER